MVLAGIELIRWMDMCEGRGEELRDRWVLSYEHVPWYPSAVGRALTWADSMHSGPVTARFRTGNVNAGTGPHARKL